MDLEKLKQLDNQNEQNRKKRYEDRMAIPIKEWNEKLNSEGLEKFLLANPLLRSDLLKKKRGNVYENENWIFRTNLPDIICIHFL